VVLNDHKYVVIVSVLSQGMKQLLSIDFRIPPGNLAMEPREFVLIPLCGGVPTIPPASAQVLLAQTLGFPGAVLQGFGVLFKQKAVAAHDKPEGHDGPVLADGLAHVSYTLDRIARSRV